jgi:hypothetical protein
MPLRTNIDGLSMKALRTEVGEVAGSQFLEESFGWLDSEADTKILCRGWIEPPAVR